MTPLPGVLGGTELVAWRLDHERHAATWHSGEGAFLRGGRWNSSGTRVVYCAVDPSTAILEVAVHVGFASLDVAPHVLTSLIVEVPDHVHVVQPEDIPDLGWLRTTDPSRAQQGYGDSLLAEHKFVLLPSVVSRHSWNMLVSIPLAAGGFRLRTQERFVLDPRLHGRGS